MRAAVVGYNRAIATIIIYEDEKMIVLPLEDWHDENGRPMDAEIAPLAAFNWKGKWFEVDFNDVPQMSVH